MNQLFLERWQAGVLCQALWATHQSRQSEYWRPWLSLTPRLPKTTPHAKPVIKQAAWRNTDYVETGKYELYYSPGHTDTPRYLPVFVPPIDELGIPIHEIEIMNSDYTALMNHYAFEEKEKLEFWSAYIGSNRVSHIFAKEKNGAYWRVRGQLPKQLQEVALEVLSLCLPPTAEELEERFQKETEIERIVKGEAA